MIIQTGSFLQSLHSHANSVGGPSQHLGRLLVAVLALVLPTASAATQETVVAASPIAKAWVDLVEPAVQDGQLEIPAVLDFASLLVRTGCVVPLTLELERRLGWGRTGIEFCSPDIGLHARIQGHRIQRTSEPSPSFSLKLVALGPVNGEADAPPVRLELEIQPDPGEEADGVEIIWNLKGRIHRLLSKEEGDAWSYADRAPEFAGVEWSIRSLRQARMYDLSWFPSDRGPLLATHRGAKTALEFSTLEPQVKQLGKSTRTRFEGMVRTLRWDP